MTKLYYFICKRESLLVQRIETKNEISYFFLSSIFAMNQYICRSISTRKSKSKNSIGIRIKDFHEPIRPKIDSVRNRPYSIRNYYHNGPKLITALLNYVCFGLLSTPQKFSSYICCLNSHIPNYYIAIANLKWLLSCFYR